MAEKTEAPPATQAATSAPGITIPTQAATTATKSRNARKIQQKPISKKRKFVKDGVFYAEINDYFKRELSENGYAGCEVRVTPTRTEIIIRATKANDVVGPNGKKIRELTALIQKKFNFPKKGVILFCEKIRNQGLSALAQSEAVKFRLLQGLSVRRAAYSVLKFIMDKGADGCEITISGKLRGQRAKAMKFRDGYMIHAGDAVNYYIDHAIKHVHLRQGVIGIRVKIMLPHTETDRDGRQIVIVPRELPDKVHIKEPKDIDFDEDAKNQEQFQHGIQQDFTTQQQQQQPQTASHISTQQPLTGQQLQNTQDVQHGFSGSSGYAQQSNINNENQDYQSTYQNTGQSNDFNQYGQQFDDYNDGGGYQQNQQNDYYQNSGGNY